MLYFANANHNRFVPNTRNGLALSYSFSPDKPGKVYFQTVQAELSAPSFL